MRSLLGESVCAQRRRAGPMRGSVILLTEQQQLSWGKISGSRQTGKVAAQVADLLCGRSFWKATKENLNLGSGRGTVRKSTGPK